MKKKLLFVQESLRVSGSEKSMVTLLKNLNPELYEIDVQLMSYGGELEKEIPNYINLLTALEYNKFTSRNWIKSFLSIRKLQHVRFLKARLKYSLILRKGNFNILQKAQFSWESIGKVMPTSNKDYDVAIAFTQGFPTFYVADKIKARKKICWINAIMRFEGENGKFQEKYYRKFDSIVCITEKVKEYVQKGIPSISDKLVVMSNIVDYNEIINASNSNEVNFGNMDFNILTVGRLDNGDKGMDIAINASKILMNKTINFHWYFLGDGYFKEEMEEFINDNQLQEFVTLLGSDSNPYPYFKAANLYVHTSRREGYGRTIAEARMLNLPIVTTNFDAVGLQIQHLKNGIITEMDPQAVAEGIEHLMKDKDLYKTIVKNLEKEPKENLETVQRFDAMIDELLAAN